MVLVDVIVDADVAADVATEVSLTVMHHPKRKAKQTKLAVTANKTTSISKRNYSN